MQLLGSIIFIVPAELHLYRHVSIYLKTSNQGPSPACKMDTGFYLLIVIMAYKARTLGVLP